MKRLGRSFLYRVLEDYRVPAFVEARMSREVLAVASAPDVLPNPIAEPDPEPPEAGPQPEPLPLPPVLQPAISNHHVVGHLPAVTEFEPCTFCVNCVEADLCLKLAAKA
jgi:hypothetical protein